MIHTLALALAMTTRVPSTLRELSILVLCVGAAVAVVLLVMWVAKDPPLDDIDGDYP